MDHIDDELDGESLGPVPDVRCDRCSSELRDGDLCGGYASNWILNAEETERVGLQRTYCPDCRRDGILLPTSLAQEAYYEFALEERSGELYLTSVRVLDESGVGDGVPWNPKEVWEAVAGKPFDETLGLLPAGQVAFGPEDVSDGLDRAGVDVGDLIDWQSGDVRRDVDADIDADDLI